MGMLLTYHKGYRSEAPADEPTGPKPLDRQNKSELQESARAAGVSDEGSKRELVARIREKQEADEQAERDEDARYDDLSDEQVAEAYALTLPEGEATERDAQVVELRAVSAFAHTFADQPTEGGSDSE